jgi:hypothetical protein
MSTPYVYHPLPPASQCIRVLDIISASAPDVHSDAVHIEGRLRVIDLTEQPAFTALSYVWGAYAPTPDQILCDGARVAVTSNCHSALRHLRRKLGHFTIWIDAICINQEDTTEKEQQIPLMGDIYSKADSVFIWLGDATRETDRAMTWLQSSGFQEYFATTAEENKKSRPFAAATSIWLAAWSTTRHPIPFQGKLSMGYLVKIS